ncbi:MAG: hypothetical protein GF364_02730 [Candidatus Lokiarchaeota archaeon]|nr:hypothetical protein [Candidatus Lokiarchaeota archaeon]
MAVSFTIGYELLGDILLIDFGLDEDSLGVIYAAIFFANALFSRSSSYLSNKISPLNGIIIVLVLFGITYVFTPFVGVGILVLFTLLRNLFYSINENLRIEVLNKNIKSSKRATALSSFSMLRVGGYSLLAFLSAPVLRVVSPVDYAFVFGGIIFIASIGFWGLFINRKLR